MAQYLLDEIFTALADPTRRAVVGRLGRGPASVGELAEPFDMALPSFLKHIHMLEGAGLISTYKAGRVRTCEINRENLAAVGGWLEEQKLIWTQKTDRLEEFLTQEQDETI
jgi:DNA-binding transcriptional ArsR family regulator